MKYKESDMARSSDGRIVYEITELDEGELLGKAMGELMNEGKLVVTMSSSGFTWRKEIEKLGISYEALSDSWGIPADVIRSTLMGEPPEFYRDEDIMEELISPLSSLAIPVAMYTWHQKGLARHMIDTLTTTQWRKLEKQQLTMAAAAKFAGVEEELLERFSKGEDCLTAEEVSRVCIALLQIDRILNYRSRYSRYIAPGTEV